MNQLQHVPGLAGYLASQQNTAQQEQGQLQQFGQVIGLKRALEQQEAARQAQSREAQFRLEMSQATTPEAQAAVASRYAPAHTVLQSLSASEDRRAQRDARAAELTQRGEQEIARIREAAAQQRITREEADRREATMRENLARLIATMRPPVPSEPLERVVGKDGNATLVPRSKAVGMEPYTVRDTPAKALPSALSTKYLENIQNLRKAERAAALLDGNSVSGMTGDVEATGNKGLLSNLGVIGDKVLNAFDPKGVDTRAAIGDLGSMVIHDRSGAAVTAAEFPRLRPFIPLASDSPEVARKKVKRFVQEYKAEVEAQKEFFTASGYKVPELGNPKSAPAPSDVPPPPPGFNLN